MLSLFALWTNLKERNRISALFQLCLPCNEEMFQFFVSDYVLHLTMDVVKFVSASMRPNTETLPQSDADPNDKEATAAAKAAAYIEYLKTIHYISGSKVRAFYIKSRQFPKIPVWKRIGRVIAERLLESEVVPGPPAIAKG